MFMENKKTEKRRPVDFLLLGSIDEELEEEG